MSLVDEVIDAHGGLTRWRSSAAIRWRLSSGGPAFAAKGQRQALADVTATVATFGRWAKASQAVGAYREFDGLMVATRRPVHPQWWPHGPLPWSGSTCTRVRPCRGSSPRSFTAEYSVVTIGFWAA